MVARPTLPRLFPRPTHIRYGHRGISPSTLAYGRCPTYSNILLPTTRQPWHVARFVRDGKRKLKPPQRASARMIGNHTPTSSVASSRTSLPPSKYESRGAARCSPVEGPTRYSGDARRGARARDRRTRGAREERAPRTAQPARAAAHLLLSQPHRLRALILLGQFVDLGLWAAHLTLAIRIFL